MRREKLAAAANAALADRERGTWGRDVGVIEIYVFARRKLPGARYALPVLSPLDSPPGVSVVLSLPALFSLPFLLVSVCLGISRSRMYSANASLLMQAELVFVSSGVALTC